MPKVGLKFERLEWANAKVCRQGIFGGQQDHIDKSGVGSSSRSLREVDSRARVQHESLFDDWELYGALCANSHPRCHHGQLGVNYDARAKNLVQLLSKRAQEDSECRNYGQRWHGRRNPKHEQNSRRVGKTSFAHKIAMVCEPGQI